MPNERVYQSGATKRKKRSAERQEAAKSRKVFEGFFKKKPDKITENKWDFEDGEEKYHHSEEPYKDTAAEETLEVEMTLDERSSAEETSGEPFATVRENIWSKRYRRWVKWIQICHLCIISPIHNGIIYLKSLNDYFLLILLIYCGNLNLDLYIY